MRYPKLRELKEAIKALIKGPYTSHFPHRPHIPYERFRGKPQFDRDNCIGCGACVNICPSKALSFEDKIKNNIAKRVFTHHLDMCIFCGQCQMNCPTEKGLILSQEFDLATTEGREELRQQIEKDLVLCEGCNEIIAPYDQILWVAKKLGPLIFSNTSLMLFYLSQLNLAFEEEISPKKEEFLRSDRIKILCPKCRREVVIKS